MRSVQKSYDGLNVLTDVSFDVPAGTRVALLGPGGCGKTTLLKILLGLERPDSGSVTLLGTDMVNASDSERRQTLKRVGMAFQQGALFDFMTVRENLLFAMENMTELTPEAMVTKLKDLLAGVKLPATEKMFPYELSGGMQRRIGIARALATDPTVAIFDEPTSGLDPVTSTIVLNMIHDLGRGAGDSGTQLISTSNVEIALRFADRILLLNEGRIVADGSWKQLLVEGDDWVRHFLGVRLIGLDLEYAKGLGLPAEFMRLHWNN